MADRQLVRRAFLEVIARRSTLAGLAILAPSWLGCGGPDRDQGRPRGGESSQDGGAPSKESAARESASKESAANQYDPCGDLSALTDEERDDRQTVEYVPVTADAEKRCDNCQLWIAPENGSPCGGCDILAGPIHPRGYCTAWSAV